MRTVLYIFGAGASRAVHSDMPLMDDFFEKIANYAEPSKRQLWHALVVCEYARLFEHRNADCENLAARILEHEWSGHEDICPEGLVSQYLTAFRKRQCENFERVFDAANVANEIKESQESKTGVLPKTRLLVAADFLLRLIDKRIDRGKPNPYRAVARHAARRQAQKGTYLFVSFNYDLLLDRELADTGSWWPQNGYRYCFQQGVSRRRSPSVALEQRSGSPLELIKPHGSINWRVYADDPGAEPILVTDAEGKSVLSLPFDSTVVEEGDRLLTQPLIVPPTVTKASTQQILYSARRSLGDVLLAADEVVAIGWSLPSTDQDIRRWFETHVFRREEQLGKLTIVTKGEDRELIDRLVSVFWPVRHEVVTCGFKKWAMSLSD